MVRHTKADVPRIPAPIRIKVWLPFTRPEQQSYNTIVANLLTNLVLTTGIVGADGETRPPKPESMLHASNQVGSTPLLSRAATSFILEHPTTFLPPVRTARLPQQRPTTNRPPTTATTTPASRHGGHAQRAALLRRCRPHGGVHHRAEFRRDPPADVPPLPGWVPAHPPAVRLETGLEYVLSPPHLLASGVPPLSAASAERWERVRAWIRRTTR